MITEKQYKRLRSDLQRSGHRTEDLNNRLLEALGWSVHNSGAFNEMWNYNDGPLISWKNAPHPVFSIDDTLRELFILEQVAEQKFVWSMMPNARGVNSTGWCAWIYPKNEDRDGAYRGSADAKTPQLALVAALLELRWRIQNKLDYADAD